MRKPALIPTVLTAAAFFFLGALAPASAQPQQQPAQADQTPAPPKAYKPVPVKPAQPVSDPTFNAFRQQLTGIAQKKDRAALARLVARNFFWIPEGQDVADKQRSAIENLAKAIGLDGSDLPGWEILAGYAGEATADPMNDPERPGAICGPGGPVIADTAFDELIATSQTDPAEWGYPARDGIDVRSGPEPSAPAIEKLGMHLVRAFPDESPAAAVHGETLRIVTPSGKLGFIPIDQLLPLVTDQLCYVKEGTAWKIAGLLGGGAPAK
jgi:hypothetical protein